MSAGLLSPATQQPEHHVGETKSVNGVTYRLNENSRWTRDQDDDGTPDANESGMGGGMADPQEPPKPAGPDHATRHKVAAAALKTVEPAIGGLIRAFHESPEYKAAGETSRHDVAPKQAKAAYDWLSQNAGPQAQGGKQAGGGTVMDFGNGRIGFSSAAGAFFMDAPGAGGKQQVHYTTNTGPVSRAAQGGGDEQPEHGANAGEPADGADDAVPAGEPSESGHPSGLPVGKAVSGVIPWGTAVPSPPAAPAKRRATPGTSAGIAPPVDARPARQAADAAKAQHDTAVEGWQGAIARGATPKELARHRAHVSSLKQIWRTKDQSAAQAEKSAAATTKEAGKEISGKRAAQGKAEAAKIGGMQAEPTAPKAAKVLKPDYNTIQPEKPTPLLDKPGGGTVPGAGKPSASKTPLLDKPGGGPVPGAGKSPTSKTPLLDKPAGGAVPTSDPLSAEALKLPRGQSRSFEMLPKLSKEFGVSHSPENRQQILTAMKKGIIKNPRDLRTILRTSKRLHERGNMVDPKTGEAKQDHAAVKEAIGRKSRRDKGQQPWSKVRKQKADEWDMTPDEFDGIAHEVWKDKKAHIQERESAKEALRKASGMTAADINRLENQGLDSGSDHPDIPGLDDIGRSLAGQYAGLGWGAGYEDEGGADVDYAELAWNLLREGKQTVPAKGSPEFVTEVDDYLSHRLNSVMSQGASSPMDRNVAAIPFGRRGRAVRYAKWIAAAIESDHHGRPRPTLRPNPSR